MPASTAGPVLQRLAAWLAAREHDHRAMRLRTRRAVDATRTAGKRWRGMTPCFDAAGTGHQDDPRSALGVMGGRGPIGARPKPRLGLGGPGRWAVARRLGPDYEERRR